MSKSWGEEVEEAERTGNTGPDVSVGSGDGLKTTVEYRTNEKGEKVKVTRTVREYTAVRRIPKRVEERRKRWKKFGKCANATGLEAGISGIAEPVFLILGDDARKQKEVEEKLKKEQNKISEMYRNIVAEVNAGVTPGVSGGPALYRPRFRDATMATSSNPSGASSGGGGGMGGGRPGLYVPVHLRGRGGPGATPFESEETATLRVTNLSEETSEQDLQSMFQPFGHLQRVYLAKEKETYRSKGFAFVSYVRRRDAQAAMDALNGKGWDYLILNIEWADARKPM